MKVLKLIISGYNQFKHLELDFTNPITGKPLDKICFIGRNATGKSTILWLLSEFIFRASKYPDTKALSCGKLIFLVEEEKERFYFIYWQELRLILPEKVNIIIPNWQDSLFNYGLFYDLSYEEFARNMTGNYGRKKFDDFISLVNESKFTFNNNYKLIYCPPESSENSYLFEDVPETNLNEALKLERNSTNNHIVSHGTAKDFWKQLIYEMNLREKEFKKYAIDNKTKSYEHILEEFDKNNPDIFYEISTLWNKILDKAGLYLDIENIKTPTVLTDNLQAYIKSNKETDEKIPYNQLSTGIRNFIFTIGHIYSLFFNKKIDYSFLLVDEPENSLFPDFLYDLIDEIYHKIIENQNTQFFIATHNPIIASQFEPYERIILDFDDNGYVIAKKGTVPAGDDPNDILYKDFGMRSVYTKKGLENWEHYLELKTLIRETADETLKNKLIEEFSKLGREYNFPSK